jgi:lanthanide-dependent methanol dehydrogenase
MSPKRCDRKVSMAFRAKKKRRHKGGPQMRLIGSVLLTTVASIALLAATATTALANDDVTKLTSDPKNWAIPTGDYANTRYSKLDQINASNVKNLQVKWTFSTGVLRGHEGGPLVVGDVMYIHAPFPNTVFALDLKNDGKIIWKYEPRQDPNVIPIMCCDTVNRGVAYAEGKVFLYQADSTLVALDAKTGKPIWSVKNAEATDGSKGESGTSAPMVVKDKVLVGISGGEFGVRGHMTAYNINDGKKVWRAYSMGPDADTLLDPEKTTHLGKPVGKDSGTATWEGEQWKIGGGTTWGWYSYDPKLNLVYYGTGNPSTWNPVQRPGDNRWSMTIMARDADTGVAKWMYQMTPHDEWDFDGINEMILVDGMDVGGAKHDVLVHFDRNGFAYTLDRASGELLVAKKYDPKVNWATEVVMDKNSDQYGRPQVVAKYSTQQNGEDTNTTGICPAALGTKDQQPATYSPKTGLFYVPTNHVCMDYEPYKVSYTAGQPYVGATVSMYPAPESHGGMGNFIAWDAAKGEIVWSKPEQFSVWSGALATAGDIVFYGTLEGYIKAVDKKDGKELYKFKTPSGIIGNINTFEAGGKQYIAVLSGVGGWAGIGLAGGLLSPENAAAWHGAVDQGRAQGDEAKVVNTAGLGAVGGYAGLAQYTSLGGVLTVFGLPE